MSVPAIVSDSGLVPAPKFCSDITTIDSKGRIVIPADIRRSLGWCAGDKLGLNISVSGDFVLLRKNNDGCSSVAENRRTEGASVCFSTKACGELLYKKKFNQEKGGFRLPRKGGTRFQQKKAESFRPGFESRLHP